jgi:hypothetical protein
VEAAVAVAAGEAAALVKEEAQGARAVLQARAQAAEAVSRSAVPLEARVVVQSLHTAEVAVNRRPSPVGSRLLDAPRAEVLEIKFTEHSASSSYYSAREANAAL